MWKILLLPLIYFAAWPAMAGTVSKQEELFRRAMAPGADPDNIYPGERALDPGIVIRAYIDSGHIRRKPDLRADYVDLRKFRKPATLFGHTLIAIEEEYLTIYIGCCVNPGFGAVIEVSGPMAELEAYATLNKCRIDELGGPESIMADLKIAPKSGSKYHHLRCRDNDVYETQ